MFWDDRVVDTFEKAGERGSEGGVGGKNYGGVLHLQNFDFISLNLLLIGLL